MHFLFTLNNAYAPHLAATLVSILRSQMPGHELHFHIISSDFTEETKTKIHDLKKIRPFVPIFYTGQSIPFDFSAMPLTLSYITRETYYRCFAHEFVKSADRIIHLDVDLLVLRDLGDLWNINLSGALATGVRCPIMDGRHLKAAGFNPRKHIYSLAGMNLFDLKKMREINMTERVDFIFKNYAPLLRGQDQDVLNLCFLGKLLEISPTYNFATSYLEDPRSLKKFREDPHFKTICQAPHVVHFSREIKAWHNLCRNPFKTRYWDCLAQTPWKGMGPAHLPIRKYVEIQLIYFRQTNLFRTIAAWFYSLYDPFHLRQIKKALAFNRARGYSGPQKGQKLLTHISQSQGIFYFFEKMIGCTFTKNPKEANAAFLWGTKYFPDRGACLRQALDYHLPLILAEDGFIRSLDVAFMHDPGLSCLMDSSGIYYNADLTSLFDNFLNGTWEMSPQEKEEAERALIYIRENGLSKYNTTLPAPVDFNPNKEFKNVVLVLDQRKNDQSVVGAKANTKTFRTMLADAIKENPNGLILVKTHPDANTGFFGGYYDGLRPRKDNVVLLKKDLNPFSLLAAVDNVYVVSSQMGMEALFCGKKVFCYGAPFYSGWGLTQDRGAKRIRQRKRTTLELFFTAYIRFARYFDPSKMEPCSLIDVLKYLKSQRDSA